MPCQRSNKALSERAKIAQISDKKKGGPKAAFFRAVLIKHPAYDAVAVLYADAQQLEQVQPQLLSIQTQKID